MENDNLIVGYCDHCGSMDNYQLLIIWWSLFRWDFEWRSREL